MHVKSKSRFHRPTNPGFDYRLENFVQLCELIAVSFPMISASHVTSSECQTITLGHFKVLETLEVMWTFKSSSFRSFLCMLVQLPATSLTARAASQILSWGIELNHDPLNITCFFMHSHSEWRDADVPKSICREVQVGLFTGKVSLNIRVRTW